MKKESRSPHPHGKKHTDKARLVVTEPAELMKFLLVQLPKKSRNNIKSLLANKQVFVEGKPVKQFNHPLTQGQVIEIRWNRIPEEKKYRGLTIIFEDEDIVVIDKHAGMLSIATGSEKVQTAYSMLSTHVKSQDRSNRIFVVHRLDRETSGLMMFARSEKVQHILQSDWHNIVSERAYIAVVEGVPAKAEGTITSFLHESKALIVYSSHNPASGHKAVTNYQLMKSGREFSMLKMTLETGRKHQIRVQMQSIGHPVSGDKKYGAKSNPMGRVGLHAWILAFRHPVNNEELRFETPIPGKFKSLF